METKKNIKLTAVIWAYLFFTINVSFSQSSLTYTKIDGKKNIGILTYDGSMKSIADSDIIKLQAYNYLSIGKVKKYSLVSNGCVYTLVRYPKKQFILIKSDATESSQPRQKENWVDVDVNDLNICMTFEDQITESRNRVSLFKNTNSVTIAILNIKKSNLALFMYMADSISFEP